MEKKRLKENLVCAFVFLILSIYLIASAIPGQIAAGKGLAAVGQGADSRTFPYFAAWVMGVAALGEILSNVYRYRTSAQEEDGDGHRKAEWGWELRALAVFGLCLVYAILFDIIGYLPATFLVPPVVLYVMGSRKWQHYLCVYAVAIAVYVVFRYVLNVQVP